MHTLASSNQGNESGMASKPELIMKMLPNLKSNCIIAVGISLLSYLLAEALVFHYTLPVVLAKLGSLLRTKPLLSYLYK